MEFRDLLPDRSFSQCKNIWIAHEASIGPDCLPAVIYVPAIVALVFALSLPFRSSLYRLVPEWLLTFGRDETRWSPPDDSSRPSKPWTRPSRLLLSISLLSAVFSALSATATWSNFPPLLVLPLVPSLASAFIVAARHPRTTPVDVLIIHLLLLFVQLLISVGSIPPLAVDIVPFALELVLCLAALWIIVRMPMRDPLLDTGDISSVGATPSGELRSPEDNFTLWNWMTIDWLAPLLAVGSRRKLDEQDIWRLPLIFSHSRLFLAIRDMKGSLFWRVFVANWLDFTIVVMANAIITLCGILEIVLLKQILATLDHDRRDTRAAVAYSFIIFFLRLVEGQLDVFSTWYKRRSYERSRGQLITSIHEKALRRKIYTFADNSRAQSGHESAPSSSGLTTAVPSATASIDDGTGGEPDETTALLTPSKPPSTVEEARTKKKTWAGALTKVLRFGKQRNKDDKVEVDKKKKIEKALGKEDPASSGKILQLIKNDAYDVSERFWRGADLFGSTPIHIALSVYLIWKFLGPSSFFGLAFVIVCQLASFLVTQAYTYYERKRRAISDRKNDLTNSFVIAIRHLRWYDWQDEWLSRIFVERNRELFYIVIVSIMDTAIYVLSQVSSLLFTLAAFYAYTVWSGNRLTVDIAFPCLELFDILNDALLEIPRHIKTWAKAWVAAGRINSFMKEPDKEGVEDGLPIGPIATPTAAAAIAATARPLGKLEVSFAAGTFSWPGTQHATLSNVDASFPVGLTLVCGRVGSGKSALVRAILGELDRKGGVRNVPDEAIAYCDQRPWLENLSLRENILFSSPFEESRYHEVLDACCLIPDFSAIKGGDLAQIGENGVGLSGGQKARVSLARAIYSRARILLLDDPIAALDQDTAGTVMTKLFRGSLLKGRVVVFVTHRTELALPYANQVLEVAHGQVRTVPLEEAENLVGAEDGEKDKEEYRFNFVKEDAKDAVPDKLIEAEHRADGAVIASVYWRYVKVGTLKLWLMLVAVTVGFRFCHALYYYFLKLWGESYPSSDSGAYPSFVYPGGVASITAQPVDVLDLYSTNQSLLFQPLSTTASFLDRIRDYMGLPNPDEDVGPWFLWFGVIVIGKIIMWVLCDVSTVMMQYVSGKRMYIAAMKALAGANFRFYDVTPIGRLLNRVLSDLSQFDGEILWGLQICLWYVVGWASSLVIIATATPTFLAIAVVTSVGFVILFWRFIKTAQSLRRLETTRLSPLFTNVGVLLDGLVTIRAFKAESHFQQRIMDTCDSFQSMDHFYWSCQTWLQYRFDLVSAVSTFTLSMFAILSGISSGTVAFLLSAAGGFVTYTHHLCKHYGELQLKFISVERVLELVDVAQEAEGTIDPPASWPSSGDDIVYDDVTVRYSPELEPAIKNVSFRIPAGSSVTIRGRTGSGKSTLALSLLGTILPDAEGCGKITIGGVSIADVNKHALRRRITFVAQDPVLFPGTLRNNLDPMDEHTDEECASVLDRVLNDTARDENRAHSHSQPFSLETKVDAGGSNLSQGQRQLIGMGRAILRRSAIVILDESTASIDVRTSENIQKLLRTELQNCTVVNIAHRQEAIMNAEWLLEMSEGRLKEFRKVQRDEVSRLET